jgi:hypothetical protein
VPAACTPERAERTSVAAIARRPERFVGRCVTVSGPAAATTIYTSVEGSYLAHRGRGGHASGPPASLHKVGLYSPNAELRERYYLSPLFRLTVTGTVDTCALMQQRAEAAGGPEIRVVTLGGHCHWQDGAVIHAVSWSEEPPRSYRRLMGERARARVGSFARLPQASPQRAALESFANDFLRALRAGDRAALAQLHDVAPQASERDPALRALLDDPGSVWAEIRRGPVPRRAIFAPTRPQSAAPEPAGDLPEGLACFCRVRDCSGAWPIAWADADNAAERPYACTFVQPAEWLPRRARLGTPERAAWRAEPARTAFRRQSDSSRR